MVYPMGLPTSPVALTVQQVEDLNKRLSTLRHNVNNHLALIVAAVELIKVNPDMLPRMTITLTEQPPKITEEIKKFTAAFEQALGIARNSPEPSAGRG
jgi:hypothetical protein